MCIFKKKKTKKSAINSKYQLGEWVRFRHKGEVDPGVIYDMRQSDDGEVIYDVQIGGECPIVVKDVKETEIFVRRK